MKPVIGRAWAIPTLVKFVCLVREVRIEKVGWSWLAVVHMEHYDAITYEYTAS